MWLEEGGRLGFIVSSKFLSTGNGQWLRELILNQCVIEEIVDLMRVQVFTQDVYPLIIILRKESNETKRDTNEITVKIISTNDLSLLKEAENQPIEEYPEYQINRKSMCYKIPQSWFKSNPRSIFEINCSNTLKQFRDKVTDPETTVSLKKILDVRQGVIAGGNAKWKKRLQDLALPEYGENFTVLEKDLPNVPTGDRGFLKKLVNGDSVGEFIPNWSTHRIFLIYDENHLTAPREPSVFEQKEKLILKAKTEFLMASIDYENIFVTNDTYIAKWQDNPEYRPNIKYLLGLLNSKVLDLFYKIRHCEYVQGGWFVRYGVFFDELPIKKANPAQEKEVVTIVDQIIENRKNTSEDEKALSSLILAMESAKIDVTTAGLSTVIDLNSRKGGEEAVDKLSIRGTTIYFNKLRTASITCISENSAQCIFALMVEQFETLKNRSLNEVMSSVRIPGNALELQKFNNFIKSREQAIIRRKKQIDKLKAKLDEKVIEIYDVKNHLETVYNSLKIIAGKIQENEKHS